MQNVVFEENKELKYTLFSLCPLKKNPIQRFWQIKICVRILFGLNQLTPIVHFYFLFLLTDMK